MYAHIERGGQTLTVCNDDGTTRDLVPVTYAYGVTGSTLAAAETALTANGYRVAYPHLWASIAGAGYSVTVVAL